MRILSIIALVGAVIAALYYLYQAQLGAISFFMLSILFFILAARLLRKKEGNEEQIKKTKEKSYKKAGEQ
ncbi:hypothetical protein SAMN05192533_114124 [Mesobacillus persicus]|uniref:Uncharacterized protein n=1 Tax=Mesobacillus persicus TaxID=930146 RepID=A0A1H8H994_9BACI|nr:hypothetical protein [Mesobacillus persicus]SEN52782.1 hypothetical protein SAMN05192533_114124 [Mesobacillus persicus]